MEVDFSITTNIYITFFLFECYIININFKIKGFHMIEVSNLSKNFGTFKAVDNISFSIPTGQIIGLLGPNGAGKSTTMRMVTGYLTPSSGSIKIDGVNIEEDSVKSKQKIGYMPESAPLYGEMIVEDYLNYVAQMQGVTSETKIYDLCKECGLKEVMHKNISELSRGYKQRVGLAHALMNDPEILILDEPTSGLDPNQIGDVRNLIKEIGKTRTVIISTHILGEVEMLCDRVIIISGGKIVADNPTKELRELYGKTANLNIQVSGCSKAEFENTISKFGCSISYDTEETINNPKFLKAIININNKEELCPEIAKAIINSNWNLYELSIQKNSLEDIFHILTEEN